jgi:hypothetical protein
MAMTTNNSMSVKAVSESSSFFVLVLESFPRTIEDEDDGRARGREKPLRSETVGRGAAGHGRALF